MEEKRFVIYTVLDEVYIVDSLIVNKAGRTVSFKEDEELIELGFDDISQLYEERVIRDEIVLEDEDDLAYV
jgi:hypothetical protein